MSARRLAKEQPDYKMSASATKQIKAWMKKYPKDRSRSAMIPALWIIQKDVALQSGVGGWLPEAALRALGDMLDTPYIRIYEVATFYTMFNLQPVGKHHIQVCGTTPCWLRGAGDITKVCADKIGPKGSVSDDGQFSWIEVECLGACTNAPMVQISNTEGDGYYEDLNTDNFTALLDDLAEGKKVEPGPQNSRHTSEAEGGAGSLTTKGLYNKIKKKKLPNSTSVKKAPKKKVKS
jgi:NADH-quinone oxidoreductase subunit E